MTSFSADATETIEKHVEIPPLPLDRVYTANYCEENIYLLAKKFLEDGEVCMRWSVFAVFISNNTRTVALWSQTLREDVVVWDYHVILALKPRVSSPSTGGEPQAEASASMRRGSTWIYDFDSRLGMPCRWEEYVDRTFPYSTCEASEAGWTIPAEYESLFRIVDGEEFLENFASDRSHMLVAESNPPHYHSPVPPYPCIRGTRAAALGVTNNLMNSFVCMDNGNAGIGSVYTLGKTKEFFEGRID